MRFRLPMIGHGVGPGGRFLLVREVKSFEQMANVARSDMSKTSVGE